MEPVTKTDIEEVLGATHYMPAVSIILPFEPKMSLKAELAYSLTRATEKVERELSENYPAELGLLVMQKLTGIIKSLNFNTHKKSIAIYVSPVFEKVLYLDIPVEEKVMVDQTFEIRDLEHSKKQYQKYLVLLLSMNECRIYLGDPNSFTRIVSNTPDSIHAYVNDPPQRVANFSDMADRKEVIMEKFLRHTDNTLDIILQAYQLPLFVLGSKRIIGHFRKLSKHTSSIIDFIHGNFERATLAKLRQVIEPHIANWQNVRQKVLLNQIEQAANENKLATGIREVWKEAVNHRGRLLIVEKDLRYEAQHGSTNGIIYKLSEPYNKFSYIKDAVDDVIEKVLEHGGDVEFVEKGVLNAYKHIALLLYY